MTDYKELIEELRDKACNYEGYERELCNQAADAIEQLIIDGENYKEILFSYHRLMRNVLEEDDD